MTKVKKEDNDMLANTTTTASGIPLPGSHRELEKKRPLQVEVSVELFSAVHRELKKRNLKIRQVVTWGLLAWLSQVNPAEANKIKAKITV